MTTKHASVKEYIAALDSDVKKRYQKLRKIIQTVVSGGEEVISYNIPTLKISGRYVVYYAAWKEHISLYPLPKMDNELLEKLQPYVHGKGTLRFPIDQPLPLDLIANVVRELVRINEMRTLPRKRKIK